MVTNEWKLEVHHGNADIIKVYDDAVKNEGSYDWSEDELWIEKKPKQEFPPDFIFSPIVVSCLKKEQGEKYRAYYGEPTIETPIGERKDFRQSIVGHKDQSLRELNYNLLHASDQAQHNMIAGWFLMRLQVFVNEKIGKKHRLAHLSSPEVRSLDPVLRNPRLCETVRLQSVWLLALAEEKLHSEIQMKEGRMFFYEDQKISKEKLESSLNLIELAIQLDNQNFVAFFYKGFLLYKMGDLEGAEKSFRSSAIINPLWYDSVFYEGKVLVIRGFPYHGLKKIDQAIESWPDRFSFRVYRAAVWQSMGLYNESVKEYEKAEALFEEAHEHYPISQLHYVLYSKCNSLSRLGSFPEIYETLKKIQSTTAGKTPNFLLDLIGVYRKYAEDQQPKKLKEIVKEKISDALDEIEEEFPDFMLTKDAGENIRKLIAILKKLEGYLYWSDQFFSQKAFEWISEACMANKSIKDVKLLTGTQRKAEMLARPFKRKIDRLVSSLGEQETTCQMKVAVKKELAMRYHARFIISKNVILNVPSTNNFTSGSLDPVSKLRIPEEDTEFIAWWKESVDYFEYRENEKQLEKDGKESSSL